MISVQSKRTDTSVSPNAAPPSPLFFAEPLFFYLFPPPAPKICSPTALRGSEAPRVLPRYGSDNGKAIWSILPPAPAPALAPRRRGSGRRESGCPGTRGTAAGPGRGWSAESRTEEPSTQPGRGLLPAPAVPPRGQKGEGSC